jgi:hypothetical protein
VINLGEGGGGDLNGDGAEGWNCGGGGWYGMVAGRALAIVG